MPKHYDLSEESADLETLARQVQGLARVEKKKQRQRQLAAAPDASLPKWLRNPLVRGVCLGAVVSIAIFFAFLKISQAISPKIVVPELLGQNYSSAKDALTKLGLKVKIKHIQNDAKAQGTVVALQPLSGTKIAPESEVTLSVSN